jgi:hypothetical protein
LARVPRGRAARGQLRRRRVARDLRDGGHDAPHVDRGRSDRRVGRALPARIRESRSPHVGRSHRRQ